MTVLDPMTAPAIRWGILGPGGIARRFAQEIPAYTQSRIAAVGSRDRSRAEQFIADHLAGGEVRAYGSYADLVADPDIDAIYVSTPHSEHHDHAILALEAGKPVLVEKAFALSAGQAAEVFAVARRQGLFAMEAMWSRFLSHYAVARDMIAAGELGEVRFALATHAQSLNLDPAWRMMNPALGGGALLDLGIYPLSFFHWLLGAPDRVEATGVLTSTGMDLRESIVCRYGESLAVAYDDMGASGACSAQVVGTKGRLEIPARFYCPQDLVFTPLGGEPRVVATQDQGGFQFEAAEAARCIAAGLLESPTMPWASTVEVLGMTDEVRHQLGVSFPGVA